MKTLYEYDTYYLIKDNTGLELARINKTGARKEWEIKARYQCSKYFDMRGE